MSSKPVQVTLTGPQADAVLSAIAETVAYPDPAIWGPGELRALLNARDKIEAAFPAKEA